MKRRFASIAGVLTLLLVGCAPSQNSAEAPGPSPSQPVQTRRLIVANRYEPATLAPKIYQSNAPLDTSRMFNAALTLIDDQGRSLPYLAEALPQLNTDDWRIFPDGRMETTYHLRDNLT